MEKLTAYHRLQVLESLMKASKALAEAEKNAVMAALPDDFDAELQAARDAVLRLSVKATAW